METVFCPYPMCRSSLPARAIFCGKCTRQVRCKACRDLLEPNDRACVMCGTLVGEGSVEGASTVDRAVDAAINTLEYEETDKRRAIKAHFTNTAVASMSGTISMMMGAGARALRDRPGPMGAGRIIGAQQLALPEPAAAGGEEASDAAAPTASTAPAVITSLAPGSDREQLQRVFRRDGERLKLIDSRLKASGVLDFAQRLTLLFLYAHDQEAREMVPRGDLNVILTEASLNDGNTRAWLAKTQDLITDNDQIGLSIPGRERAQTILAEVFDPNVPNKWLLSSRSQAKSMKRASVEKGEGTTLGKRKRGRPSPVDQWLAAWKSLALPVKGHDAIKDRSVLDKGIFGLWAIRRATKDDVKGVGTRSLSKFLFDAFEIKVDHRSLDKALDSEAAKGKVASRGGTTFQIQPPGMEYAEQMAGLAGGVAAASPVSVGMNGAAAAQV